MPEKVLKAEVEVNNKQLSIRRAAQEYGIPYNTLRDRVNGRIDSDNYGKETMFSSEEELGLVEHAENSARLGYGYSNTSMQRLAGELAYTLGKRPSDKPLSNCWLYSFLKRWGDRVSPLKPSTLETTRAKATPPEHIGAYFENLEKAVALHMLQDKPELIYNTKQA